MNKNTQRTAAERFRDLNRAGGLLLPNAWDPISAKVFAHAGFTAIATTSAGVAFARGLPDGERLTRENMMREVAAIAGVVALPVTADVEAGYGPAPDDVARTVDAVINAGAVGINLEDGKPGGGSPALFAVADQVKRIAAARAAAQRQDIALFVNARTDMFLAGLGDSNEQRLKETVARGQAYLDAGADMIFVPGVVDTGIIKKLADAFDGRLNVMAVPSAPVAAELFAAGARRVSVGPFAMLGMLGRLRDIAQSLRDDGNWDSLRDGAMSFGDVMKLVVPAK